MWWDWYTLHRSKSDILISASGGSSISALLTCIEHIDIRLLNGTGLMLSPNSPLISDELSQIEFSASTAGTGVVSYKKYEQISINNLSLNRFFNVYYVKIIYCFVTGTAMDAVMSCKILLRLRLPRFWMTLSLRKTSSRDWQLYLSSSDIGDSSAKNLPPLIKPIC